MCAVGAGAGAAMLGGVEFPTEYCSTTVTQVFNHPDSALIATSPAITIVTLIPQALVSCQVTRGLIGALGQ